jgi:low temperature requirement protein LtrA
MADEKTDIKPQLETGAATPEAHSSWTHHLHSRRLRWFLHPSGKRVHVAGTPDEAQGLHKTLTNQGLADGEWDVVIHGSADHVSLHLFFFSICDVLISIQVNALKESHAHQEGKRDDLRKTHGELWDEFERVAKELDRLSNELHVVSEHAVNLDANFSKYGYSAHLRTIPKGSGNTSAATSIYEGEEHHDWSSEKSKDSGEHMIFFQRPVIRQYFHKGLLWRAEEMTEVASYELFIDLFYVGILAIAGDNAAEAGSGQGFLKYVIVFVLAWKIWGEVGTYMSWIAADDIIRRLSVLIFLVMLLGVTTNMADSWEATYAPMIGFYIAARWYSATYYAFTGYMIPMVRNAMIATSLMSFLPGLLWIGSIHTEEPNRQALIWIGLFIDIFGPVILVLFERGGEWMGTRLGGFMKRTFEFIPGANIEHKIERTNAFVSLVFGYSVVALLYQSAAHNPLNAFFGKAALGLIMAFSFNWMYFEIDTFNMHTHAIRHHFFASKIYAAIAVLKDTNGQRRLHMAFLASAIHHGLHSCWSRFVQDRTGA